MRNLDPIAVSELASQLVAAQHSAAPVDFITTSYPDLTWEDARSVARASDQIRLKAGESQIGWKLGWTSQAMRDALGIDRPNWGTLWDTQVADGNLPLDNFIHPKIEPELVWRSPIDLRAADCTAEQVAALGGEWALGIEVVDPRFPSFDFQALDNTADNSSSAAIQLGGFSQIEVDLADLDVTFSDGEEARTGAGSQAMGSPLEAVAWLVRSLAEEDLHVRAGDIVFTGGLTAPFDAGRGERYTLTSPTLAETSLHFH